MPARELYEGGIAAALDDCLFAVAKEAGLAAHPTIGGGHINMDRASAFGDDPDALLRFILAFYGDSEYWKQEDGDRAHAPFLDEHQPSQRAKFEAAVERFQEAKQGPSRAPPARSASPRRPGAPAPAAPQP